MVVARGCAGLRPLGDAVCKAENDDFVALAECIARVWRARPLASGRALCGLPVLNTFGIHQHETGLFLKALGSLAAARLPG